MSVKDVLLEIISSEQKDLKTVADFCNQNSHLKMDPKLESIFDPFEAINQIAPNIFKVKIDPNLSDSQLTQIILAYLTNENEFLEITKQRWKITSNYRKACEAFITIYGKDTPEFTERDRGMSASFQRLMRYNLLGKELAANYTDKTIPPLANLLINIGSLASTYANKKELISKYFPEKTQKIENNSNYSSEIKKFLGTIASKLKKIQKNIEKEKKIQNDPFKIERMSILIHKQNKLILEKKLLHNVLNSSLNSHSLDETSEVAINNQKIAEETKKLMRECVDIENEVKEKLAKAKQLLDKNDSTITSSPQESISASNINTSNHVKSRVSQFEELTKKQQQKPQILIHKPKPLNPLPTLTIPQTTLTNQQTPRSPIIINAESKSFITPSPQQLSSSPPSSPNNPVKSVKSPYSRFFKPTSLSSSPDDSAQKKNSGGFARLKDTFDTFRTRSKTTGDIHRNDKGAQSTAQSPNLNPLKHY